MFVMIGFFLVATLIMACGLTAQCGLGLCRERKRQFDIALLPTVKWQVLPPCRLISPPSPPP